MVFFGVIGSIVSGAIYPAIAIVLGEIIDAFDPASDPSDILEDMKQILIIFLIVGCITWVGTYMFYAFF